MKGRREPRAPRLPAIYEAEAAAMMQHSYHALRKAWEAAIPRQRRIYKEPQKARRARSGEIISGLEDMRAITGDARFADAIAAMREHGFDRQTAATWRVRERQVATVCVARIDHLRKRDASLSMRLAAAKVAAMFWVEGTSFDTVVRRLSDAYKRERNFVG
jgi:hypothetical protein